MVKLNPVGVIIVTIVITILYLLFEYLVTP